MNLAPPTGARRWRAFLVASCVVGPLASCDPGLAAGGGATPISGEAVESAREDVWALYAGDSAELECSATWIAERTVLTAAHCVDATPLVLATPSGERMEVASVLAHPDFDPERPYEHDLALLTLLEAPPASAGSPAAIATFEPEVDDAITLVGYGRTRAGDDDAGRQRSGPARIADVQPLHLESRGGTGSAGGCTGDSGGPIFFGGTDLVVGVMSYLPMLLTRGCESSLWSIRVDRYSSWIREHSEGPVAFTDTRPSVGRADAGVVADGGPAASATSCRVDRGNRPLRWWSWLIAVAAVVLWRPRARPKAARRTGRSRSGRPTHSTR